MESEVLLALVSLIELERGGGRRSRPAGRPGCSGRPGRRYHRRPCSGLGRDGPEAEARYGELPWLRDALFAACRICAHLGMTGERLRALAGRVPRFVRLQPGGAPPAEPGRGHAGSGGRLPGGDSPGRGAARPARGEAWVWLAPLARRAALRVVAEAAGHWRWREELCDFYVERAQRAGPAGRCQTDRGPQRRRSQTCSSGGGFLQK